MWLKGIFNDMERSLNELMKSPSILWFSEEEEQQMMNGQCRHTSLSLLCLNQIKIILVTMAG